MLIGLTGGIASGKNYIAELFEKHGCYILDADSVVHKLMGKGSDVYKKIAETFDVLDENGEISRPKLRALVVDNSANKEILERIIHPAVANYGIKWYKEIKGRDDKAICIYHAPLLLEAAAKNPDDLKRFDAIIVIYTSVGTQLNRLKERGHPPMDAAIKLMNTQMPYTDKIKYANHIIDNNSTAENAEGEVNRVYKLLQIFQYTNRLNRKSN